MKHRTGYRLVRLIAVALGIQAGVAHSQETTIVPPCFQADTVYHAIIDLSANAVEFMYGPYRLVTCRFSYADGQGNTEGFSDRWRSRPTPWQSITERDVLRGHPSVSDTVVEVVSRVANVDPDLIRRIQPERFAVDMTGNFRLVIRIADSTATDRSFSEMVESVGRWVLSFGRAQTLDIVVSPEDAQTLYYALEPGAPVLLLATSSSGSSAQK
jgi:hypothetical protein